MKVLNVSLITLLSLISVAKVSTAAMFVGSTSAEFLTPSPTGGGIVFGGVGTNVFTTGSPLPGASTNIYQVDGLLFDTEANTQFAVANLTYTNGITITGSTVSSVPLDLTLTFTQPSGLEETFEFTFDFNFTPNTTGDPVLDADELNIANVFSTTNFNIDGTIFTLRLLGFSSDGGNTIGSTFILPEDATTQSSLFATITESVPVPEPSSILGTLVVGGAMTFMKRKRDKRLHEKYPASPNWLL